MIEDPKLPLHLTEHEASICVRDADGEALQYFYFDNDQWRRDMLGLPEPWEAYNEAKKVVDMWNATTETEKEPPRPEGPSG